MPARLVTPLLTKPVPVFSAVASAPGTVAPLESTMVPVMVARFPCAHSTVTRKGCSTSPSATSPRITTPNRRLRLEISFRGIDDGRHDAARAGIAQILNRFGDFSRQEIDGSGAVLLGHIKHSSRHTARNCQRHFTIVVSHSTPQTLQLLKEPSIAKQCVLHRSFTSTTEA